MIRPARAVALATLAAVLGVSLPAGAARSALPAHDPAYDIASSTLAGALDCPAQLMQPKREPVLLVHGTGLTAQESWSWNYAKLLPAAGFDVCMLTLPHRAMTDIQVSAEYVAYAVDTMAARTHRRVGVITHSQGGMEARWAVRWWPSVRANADDLVLLGSPNHGIVAADACAASGDCWPSVWQMAQNSRFLHALNSVAEAPGAVSVTNIYTRTDELVEPSSTVPLTGARVSNVALQDLCPKPVHHAGLLTDAVAYALTLDGLTHPGPANRARVPAATCAQPWTPGLTAADVLGGNLILYTDAASQGFAQASGVPAEPTLKSYARAYG